MTRRSAFSKSVIIVGWGWFEVSAEMSSQAVQSGSQRSCAQVAHIGRMHGLDPEMAHLGRREVDGDVVLLGAEHRLARVRHVDGQAVERGGAGAGREAEQGEEGKAGKAVMRTIERSAMERATGGAGRERTDTLPASWPSSRRGITGLLLIGHGSYPISGIRDRPSLW